MPQLIVNPTSNQTPDAGQGGSAVTGNINTGHGSTVVTSTSGGGAQTKTCRWSAFQAVSGVITAITLKIDHSSQGTLVGPQPTNSFTLAYSLNGGANWTTAVTRSNFTALQDATFSVALSPTQDISQVQVRDFMQANTVDPGDDSSATVSISNIKLEVTTQDHQVIVMM